MVNERAAEHQDVVVHINCHPGCNLSCVREVVRGKSRCAVGDSERNLGDVVGLAVGPDPILLDAHELCAVDAKNIAGLSAVCMIGEAATLCRDLDIHDATARGAGTHGRIPSTVVVVETVRASRLSAHEMGRTFNACSPFGPCVISNSTRCPSARLR